jgi:hypothetical protein
MATGRVTLGVNRTELEDDHHLHPEQRLRVSEVKYPFFLSGRGAHVRTFFFIPDFVNEWTGIAQSV